MRCLITGHSGLLGYHLVQILEKQGHEVYGVSADDRMNMGARAYVADLTDADQVEAVFQEVKPAIVYHLAALASEAKGQVSPLDMTRRNMLLSTNVLRSAINAKVAKFVYASSISVYGDARTPYREIDVPLPKDVYGVNKLAFEMELKIMANVYGFDYTIFRPHNLYGPGQNQNDLTKNVVNVFMRKLILDEPYTIIGDGGALRQFSYAPDVAEVFARAATGLSKVTMNVGSRRMNTIKDLSDTIQKIAMKTAQVEYMPSRKQEIDVFIADHKIQESLVPYNDMPLYDGLQETWEWMLKQDMGQPISIKEEINV